MLETARATYATDSSPWLVMYTAKTPAQAGRAEARPRKALGNPRSGGAVWDVEWLSDEAARPEASEASKHEAESTE